MDTAVGAQRTREKQNNFCKTNITHKNPTLNLGRGSGESLAYAVIWICFSANARSVNEKGGAGGPISWPRAPCPTFNFWASGFWVSGPTSRRLHSSTDDRRRLGHLVFGAGFVGSVAALTRCSGKSCIIKRTFFCM